MPLVVGTKIRFTPQAVAARHSRAAMAPHPKCAPTSDELHAVSTLAQGPLIPNVYDTRPATTLSVLPVLCSALAPARCRCTSVP